jgi:hypothetical protein
MLTSGAAAAAWLAVLRPILEMLFSAMGRSLNDWLADKRAEQTQRDLGAAQAANKANDQMMETIDAMDGVARPSDDAVSDSLRRGDF